MAKSKLKFVCTAHDIFDGSRHWNIEDPNGNVIGEIEKETCWVGNKHSADSYTVRIVTNDEDHDYEECFEVQNVWKDCGHETFTAHEAFMRCKRYARDLYPVLKKRGLL